MPMPTGWTGPRILPVREQARVVNDLLAKRFERILPMAMRAAAIDMWVILCYEDCYDPVFKTMVPWECWGPILQTVVLHDRGDDRGVERISIARTNMQGLMETVWKRDEKEDPWRWLREVVEARSPRKIGVNESQTIWAAQGLTASLAGRDAGR